MHQIIAALAAALALLAGGSLGALHPADATGGIGMAKPSPTAPPSLTRRPMDATGGIGM